MTQNYIKIYIEYMTLHAIRDTKVYIYIHTYLILMIN